MEFRIWNHFGLQNIEEVRDGFTLIDKCKLIDYRQKLIDTENTRLVKSDK